MSFDPTKHFLKMKGQDYLETKWRLVWLREEHPDARISTEILSHDLTENVVTVRAEVTLANGATASGHCMGSIADFKFGYLEKAETQAVGRALAMLGFGTQFTGDELSEGGRAVDSPVSRPQAAPAAASRPAPAPQPQRDPLAGLRADVAAMLEADHEGASKLPKGAADMTEDELHKALAWLKKRAGERGKQQGAPQPAATQDRPQAMQIVSDKQLSPQGQLMLATIDSFPSEDRVARALADAEAMVDSGDLTRGELEYIKRYAAEAIKLQADLAGVQ